METPEQVIITTEVTLEAKKELELYEKDKAILQEFKDKIKTLPLDERITAVALYRKVEAYFIALYPFELKTNNATEESNQERATLVEVASQIFGGKRLCNEEELKGVEDFIKEDEKEKYEEIKSTVPARINDYWIKVFESTQISKHF